MSTKIKDLLKKIDGVNNKTDELFASKYSHFQITNLIVRKQNLLESIVRLIYDREVEK